MCPGRVPARSPHALDQIPDRLRALPIVVLQGIGPGIALQLAPTGVCRKGGRIASRVRPFAVDLVIIPAPDILVKLPGLLLDGARVQLLLQVMVVVQHFPRVFPLLGMVRLGVAVEIPVHHPHFGGWQPKQPVQPLSLTKLDAVHRLEPGGLPVKGFVTREMDFVGGVGGGPMKQTPMVADLNIPQHPIAGEKSRLSAVPLGGGRCDVRNVPGQPGGGGQSHAQGRLCDVGGHLLQGGCGNQDIVNGI